MTSPQKARPVPSRWGWMSQAVASVESGLDRILADEEEAARRPQATATKPTENGSTPRASSDIKRTDSTNRGNDRLQARLATAMAKKSSSRSATPQPHSESISRSETPINVVREDVMTNRLSEDVDHQMTVRRADVSSNTLETSGIPTLDVSAPVEAAPEEESAPWQENVTGPDTLDASAPVAQLSTDRSRVSDEATTRSTISDADGEHDDKLLKVQLEHENSLSELRDEMTAYLERIDTLQRNLQILTKETVRRAKEIGTDTESSSVDRSLAEKDEKIALLIEEGTNLTKGEMQYRATIKKLRVQAMTLAKDQEATQRRAEKAEKSIDQLKSRASMAEADAERHALQLSTSSKSISDFEAVTTERNALQATLAEIRQQLKRANQRAEEAESKAQSEQLEAERKKNVELQDDLSSANVEKDLSEDKHKREVDELRQSISREKEQSRQMETEMLAEQAALESKLESLRFRAEEASSGDQGDSQAKLLRQIETLQAQYSAASQNWQGIESTLLARITALEKERDELTGREADLRRKLRDSTNKAKNVAKELEATQTSLSSIQDQHDHEREEAQKGTKLVKELKAEVSRLSKELEDAKLHGEKDLSRRIEEEKAKWAASLPQAVARVDSPAASVRKGPGSLWDTITSPAERPGSRRSHAMQLSDGLPPRINSSASVRANGIIPMPETPSITIHDDQDDFFANTPLTPASATRADSGGRLHEVISASTAAAGPSVQLVERLSTAVRRLESEKAASKDELSRLSSQRDEARQEVVNLMREVEQKRAAEERLATLEKEHATLNAKQEKTLELLGEKSEQVDELTADIIDVKQMYRQLADTMGR